MAKAKAAKKKTAGKKSAKTESSRTKVARDRTVEFLTKAGLKSSEAKSFRDQWLLLPVDRDLVKKARKFVSEHKEGWDHESWVSFLNNLKEDGWDTGRTAAGEHLASRCIGILIDSIQKGSSSTKSRKSASSQSRN